MGWHATAVAFLLEEGIRAFGRAYCLPSSVFLVGASFADGSKVGVVLALLIGVFAVDGDMRRRLRG